MIGQTNRASTLKTHSNILLNRDTVLSSTGEAGFVELSLRITTMNFVTDLLSVTGAFCCDLPGALT
jgi:hypothetical protein